MPSLEQAGGTLPDGRTFKDTRDCKKLLLAGQEHIIRALAQNIATYATGAASPLRGRETETIAKSSQARNSGMRTLIQEIVASPLCVRK